MKKRIDNILVSLDLAPSRTKAQDLILAGRVFYNGQKVLKSSMSIEDESLIEILDGTLYVSRSAQKLMTALENFKLKVANKVACDVGASTGGFTQVLLVHQISKVYCIDVGHDQLDPIISADQRVINMEGINIKYPLTLPELVDLIVADLSFISLKMVLNNIMSLMKPEGDAILLFKPQFEVGKQNVGRSGIVSDEVGFVALEEFIQWCRQDFQVMASVPSDIRGKTGNLEYLLWLKKKEI